MNQTQKDKNDLAERKCVSCAGGVEPLKGNAIIEPLTAKSDRFYSPPDR